MRHPRSSTLLPFLVLIAGILFLSISPLFVRWADAPGVVTSFYRMLTVTLVTGIILPFRQKPAIQTRRPKGIWLLPVLGGVFSAVDHGLWSTSIENTFVANATLLNYIAPLWVSLIAIFIIGEKYAGFFWAGLLMVLAGAWVVTGARWGDFSNFSFRGEGYAIVSSFFYAGYFIISQKSSEHFKVLDYLLISSGAAMVVLLIIMLFSGFSIIAYSRQTFLIFLIAGLFSQLGGYYSINYALGHISAPIVSSMLIIQPVMTALLAVWFASEALQSAQIWGGLLVLGGIFIVKAAKRGH